jgi:multimeric flavodoxin WrbA
LIHTVFEQLKTEEVETELIPLGGNTLRGCTACMKCWEQKDGRCILANDPVNEIIAKMRAAEGVLLGSPTYFADVSAEMKALIDRTGMVARANGNLFRRKVGAGVVAVRRGGAMHALQSLQNYFLINEMIIPGSSYWNIAFGRGCGEVANDAEGMETMRVLGRNMAWLIKKLAS